ncbi:MAG: sigma-70 family RNA polymerase sigma factor [Firmicutes bacterium]|nr:sigma-70 family RNA polymerase sigma factor [Bacillota bacterium]
MVKDEDSLLIDRFKKGEERAFDELVNRYMKRIYYLAYSLTNNHADALDLSQEAFIKVYQSIHKFRGKSSFYTWLYRITVNICLNHLKKEAKIKEISFDERIGVAQVDWWSNPKKALENKELQEDLTRAIDSLPPRQKAIFTLRHLEGLSHKDIASILGCSIGNIKASLFQALQKLRNKLKGYL